MSNYSKFRGHNNVYSHPLQKASRYYGRRTDDFKGRVALKLVVTKLVCVNLVINLLRFAPAEKSYCKKRPVYAVAGYTQSLKSDVARITKLDIEMFHY